MTDNEIIKAMEKFSCVNCDDNCAKESDEDLGCPLNLVKFSLDLINRQKAEIEWLQSELVATRYSENALKKENRRLIKLKKIDAIKEFVDMLEGIFGFDELNGVVIKNHIDNLVKEITEVSG